MQEQNHLQTPISWKNSEPRKISQRTDKTRSASYDVCCGGCSSSSSSSSSGGEGDDGGDSNSSRQSMEN